MNRRWIFVDALALAVVLGLLAVRAGDEPRPTWANFERVRVGMTEPEAAAHWEVAVDLPPGAVVRLGSLAFRFPEPHQFLGFAPDGSECYTCPRWTNVLYVWDARTGSVLRRHALPADEEHV